MSAVTISPSYIRLALQGAAKSGYCAEEILSTVRIPAQVLTNAKLRIPTKDFARLTHALTHLLNDETLGLLAKPTPQGSFQMLAKACLPSDTLKTAIATWEQGTNLIDSSVSAQSHRCSEYSYIAFDYESAAGVDKYYMAESQLLTFHRFHCWLANDFLPIERVDLRQERPPYGDEHRFVFYGAPVHYKQEKNAIHFSNHTLDRACQRNKNDLLDLLHEPLIQILTQSRQSHSLAIKVQLWMENIYREKGGTPHMQQASEFFKLSEQTLRRRLGADGYSFKQLKEDTRRDLAMQFIKETDRSIEDIAFHVGFSEASTFSRAFKKWTGLTPLNYRKL